MDSAEEARYASVHDHRRSARASPVTTTAVGPSSVGSFVDTDAELTGIVSNGLREEYP
jgi:hypothetical protein